MKKTMMKLLSVVMAVMMLFGTFSTIIFAASAHEHDKTTKLETIEPRCNAYGYTLYTCSCGETWATDITPKTDGIHSDKAIGEVKKEDAKPATCTTPGTAAAEKCIWCDAVVKGGETTGEVTGHNYKWVLVKGDCNTAEQIVYKCVNENCDAVDSSSIHKLNDHVVDGHEFVYKITKYPTCKLVADVAGTDKRVVGGELVGGYKVEKIMGEAEYECLDCGVKYTGIAVEWNAHTFVSKTYGEVDDCLNFTASWNECVECGYADAATYVKVNAIDGHAFDTSDPEFYKASTCLVAGFMKCTRTGCDYSETLPIAAHVTTGVASTCYTTGYEKCTVAGCTYITTLPLAAHTLVDGMPSSCFAAGYKKCSAAGCTYTEALPLANHTLTFACAACGTDVCDDCTHVGRVHKCTVVGCTFSEDAVHTEHAWGTQQYYSMYYGGAKITGEYDGQAKYCTNVDLYTKCTNEACVAENSVGHVAADIVNGTHLKMAYIAGSEYSQASCTSDGYMMVNCLVCFQNHIKLEGQAAADFVAAEIERLTAENNTTELAVYEALEDVSFVKLGHNLPADCIKEIVASDATCKVEGKTDKLVCGRNGCTFVVQESETIPVDPDAHADSALVKLGETIPGTCTTPSLTYYKCTDCGHTLDPEEGAFDAFNHEKYTIDMTTFTIITAKTVVDIKVVPYKAAVCGGDAGNYDYEICLLCNNVISVDGADEDDANSNGERDENDTLWTMDDTIYVKNHKFKDVAAKKETCTTDGWEAYQEDCKCGAPSPVSKKVIPAHGDKYAITITAEQAYAPTCLTAGVAAGRYCAECDTKDGVAHTPAWDYKAEVDLTKPVAADPWYIAPLGHTTGSHMKTIAAVDLADFIVVKGECVQESFDVRYCTFCIAEGILNGTSTEAGKKVNEGAWTIINLVDPVDHKYPTPIFEDDAEKGLVKNVSDNKLTADACTGDIIYTVTCENAGCGCTSVVKTEAAKGHYYVDNGNEVIIELDCTKIGDFANWSCAECGKVVGKQITAKHNIVEVVVYPGCELGQDGARFWACKDCDARFADDSDAFATPLEADEYDNYVVVIPSTGKHDFVEFATVEGELSDKHFKAPTELEAGYIDRNCSKCGTIREVLDRLVPTLDVTLDVEKDTVASGDVFKIDINYIGENVEFSALQINLAYDVDNVKFLKEDFNQELPAGIAVKEENGGKIVVSIYSLEGISPAEGETVSLYFRADNNFATKAVVEFIDAMAFDAEGDLISGDVFDINTGAAAKVAAVVTGDLNQFAGINAGDAIVLMDLIYAKQYNAKADMNKDGKVDVADFAILSKIIATDGSDAAYNKVIKEQVGKLGYTYERVS